MQNHLLTILILLPVIGAATAAAYSFTPGARESHHRWIALGFTTLSFLASLLLIQGAGGGVAAFRLEENYPWIVSVGAHYHVGVDDAVDADCNPFKLDGHRKAATDLLRPDVAAGVGDDRRLRFARPAVVLSVLRSVAGANVLSHRHLGRRATRLCRSQVLHLHGGRLAATASRHYRSLFHSSARHRDWNV